MNSILDRIPPHNFEIEMALLSALFINNNGFEHTDFITKDDFYETSHGIIFQAMIDLRKAKQPVDILTVIDILKKKDQLDSIGGHGYIVNICDNAPVAINAYSYAKTIKDMSTVRVTIKSCMEIIDAGYSTNNPEEFVNIAQEKILSIQTTSTKDQFFTLDQLCIEAMDRIKINQLTGNSQGLDFGFPTLGPAMTINGSKLIVIAARPGMGKTALMLSISKFLGYQGVKNTIISIEMDKEALVDRYLSEESNISSLRFVSKGNLTDSNMNNLEIAASGLSSLPITIDDSCCDIQDVKRKGRKAKKMGSKILFIDQLSKIKYPQNMTDFQGYTRNCNMLADLKKELRIPIVLLCQLNRDIEKRKDKTPTLSDLKQTGAIEEDADMIFFIYREGYYKKLEDPKGNHDQSETEIILAKNRNGAVGVEQNVLFNAKRAMFQLSV